MHVYGLTWNPLSADWRRALFHPPSQEEGVERQCCICFDEHTSNSQIAILPCRHFVCVRCHKLLMSQDAWQFCPICRAGLTLPMPVGESLLVSVHFLPATHSTWLFKGGASSTAGNTVSQGADTHNRKCSSFSQKCPDNLVVVPRGLVGLVGQGCSNDGMLSLQSVDQKCHGTGKLWLDKNHPSRKICGDDNVAVFCLMYIMEWSASSADGDMQFTRCSADDMYCKKTVGYWFEDDVAEVVCGQLGTIGAPNVAKIC